MDTFPQVGSPRRPRYPPLLQDLIVGRGRQEDVPTLAVEHEFHDKFWATKMVDFSKINVPSYILGSYSTSLHTMGAIRAYNETNTDKKWLRIHPHQEWYEDYHYQSVDDLDRFFTRYLKGEDNGWEATPKVRVSMLRFGETVPPSQFSSDGSTLSTTRSKQPIPSPEQNTSNSTYPPKVSNTNPPQNQNPSAPTTQVKRK